MPAAALPLPVPGEWVGAYLSLAAVHFGDDGPARLGVVGTMASTRQGLRDARALAGYYLA
jgi:hypothetical protein